MAVYNIGSCTLRNHDVRSKGAYNCVEFCLVSDLSALRMLKSLDLSGNQFSTPMGLKGKFAQILARLSFTFIQNKRFSCKRSNESNIYSDGG
ncbi:hypothetical protein YC2023_080375 [Brassica napus]